MINLSAAVAEAIRNLREQEGLTQEELAHKAGLHRNTVQAFEAGNSDLKLGNLGAIAEALGVEVAALLPLPRGETPTGAAIERYQQSPWAQIDQPTDDEIHWLRRSPVLRWIGREPDAEAIHLAILAKRRTNTAD